MKTVNGEKPAFGFVDNRSSSYEDNEVHYGLTKREYFAAMVMQGICSNPTIDVRPYREEIAKIAIECADELLKQLEK